MTSFILTSTDQTKRREYIKKYCLELQIDPLDITIIEKDTAIKQNLNSIGIEEIRYMQKKLFLKPIKSSTKIVILEDAQLLTIQAQNTLLKVLEEPPVHTIIILSCQSKEPLIPTIISRCKIIDLKDEKQKLSNQEINDLTEFIQNLPKMPIGEKLKKAEILAKDKEKAIIWTEKIILALREYMLKTYYSDEKSLDLKKSNNLALEQFNNIKNFQSLHILLRTTNVNPRLLLETTFISINY